jgi:hypothetical protein
MNVIILKKDGLYIREYNEELDKNQELKINKPISYYYLHEVELEEGFNFYDFFNILNPFINKFDEHFMSSTRGWPLKDWFDSMLEKDVKKHENIDSIKFRWISEKNNYYFREDDTTEVNLDTYLHLSGWSEKENCSYSLNFLELNSVRNCPMILDLNCVINEFNEEQSKYVEIFEYTKPINLHKLLSCVFNEITFFGSPKTSKNKLEDLLGNLESIKNEDETFVDFKEFELNQLEEELKEAIDSENFEWAERVKKEIEKIKK